MRRAFTLIELLVVMGIIAILTALVLPTAGAVRKQANKCICASNLRQMGNAILMYVNDNRGRLPHVVEPMWSTVPSTGLVDLSRDPRSEPQSFMNVLSRYGLSDGTLICRSAVMNVPHTPGLEPVMSYRVASANASDGVVRSFESFFLPGGDIDYKYSMKYLNGRRYQVDHVLLQPVGSVLKGVRFRGNGPFYLARDFVGSRRNGWVTEYIMPHNKQFNQLKLDMSVSLEKEVTPISSSP
jgi:prepilin-type N-terminal cleavage/methylation domain-containing protein